jgi:hypothetical protein
MTRTQPKSSPTDVYASRIARAIAKGRPPPLSAEVEEYCDSFPREVFAAFAGAARHMPPAGKDETLAIGYLVLLQRLLEHLRYRTDSGYADAAKLIADFQAHVVAAVETGQVDGGVLAFVGGALHQSNVPASPELVAATTKRCSSHADDDGLPADVSIALDDILDACDADPFQAVGSLLETSHILPAQTRGDLAGALALAGTPPARAIAVLFLLDPDSAVRRAAAGALAEHAGALTPVDIRRLIAMRNWRPERERAEVDAVIRNARAAGIDCAQWEAGAVETILATSIDGAATQGFLLLSPAGRNKKRTSTILTKGGIADAWSGEPESARRIASALAASGMEAPMLAVSRSYLDRMVAHHLVLCTESGQAPPFGLLQVAETIGGADWQPARMDFDATVAGLIAQVPKAMCEPAAIASVLRVSGDLPGLEPIAQSWFENDPQVAQVVQRARRGGATLVNYLLQSVFARRRERWANIVLRTALWMCEASADRDSCWRELSLVAKAIADGRDLTEIGLMRDIAMRTIAVLRDAAPI